MLALPRALYRYYEKDEIEEYRLRYLFLEITRSCNMSCRHCGSDCAREVRGTELDTDKWLDCIAEIKKSFSPPPFVVISGGEPLIHPDLFTIARTLKQKGFRWGMVTNALSWHDGLLDKLLNEGLCSITFSLDGPEDCHTALRQNPESWRQVLRAFKDCQSAFCLNGKPLLYEAVSCIHRETLTALSETAEILLENVVPNWRIFRIFPAGRAGETGELNLNKDQTTQMLKWIAANRDLYQKRGLSLSTSCEGWFPPFFERKLRSQHSFCRSGISIASILADGTICGCNNNHESFHQGSILTDSLADVWEKRFVEHRKREWLATICVH
jgi:MoaA/NifB/PqqE/SkfB family radical SAM enzyme